MPSSERGQANPLGSPYRCRTRDNSWIIGSPRVKDDRDIGSHNGPQLPRKSPPRNNMIPAPNSTSPLASVAATVSVIPTSIPPTTHQAPKCLPPARANSPSNPQTTDVAIPANRAANAASPSLLRVKETKNRGHCVRHSEDQAEDQAGLHFRIPPYTETITVFFLATIVFIAK
jgi:hypothetical protein